MHQPTPGPTWVAFQEPVEDSSQADSSSDQEERDHALDRAQKGARPLQPRKRKENDGASRISPVKRPRHEGARATEATKGAMRPPITTSISAPGDSRRPLSSSSQAGPSRLSNVNSDSTNISTGRSQPTTATTSSSNKPPSKTPRPRYQRLSIFNEADKEPEGGPATKQTSTQHRTTSSSDAFRRTSQSASASTSKPSQFDPNNVIEISSDEAEPSPPRGKPSSSRSSFADKPPPPTQTFRARKSTGSGPKPKSKPPADTEFILISDGDEEPPGRLSNSVKAPSAQGSTLSSRRDLREPDSDDAMVAEHDAVAVSIASPDMEVDEPEADHAPPTSLIATSPARTNALTSSKLESHSPKVSLRESPSTKPPSTIRSPAKKPVLNRHGLNDIPVPSGQVSGAPQRQKNNVQFAVKSASVGNRRMPSSSSGSYSSDSPKGSTSRESEEHPSHDGIDMRNLSDVLDVESQSTKLLLPKQAQPAPPAAERAVLPLLPKPASGRTNTDKYFSGHSGGSGGLSLVDAINRMSQSNAVKPHSNRIRPHVPPVPVNKATISEAELQKARESSKLLVNALASRKGKERAESSSSIAAAAPALPRRFSSPASGSLPTTNEPSPPPVSPSPVPEDSPKTSFSAPAQRPSPAPLNKFDSSSSERMPPTRPSASALQNNGLSALAKSSDPVRTHIRPLSMTGLSQRAQSNSPQFVPATPSPDHSPKPSPAEVNTSPSRRSVPATSPEVPASSSPSADVSSPRRLPSSSPQSSLVLPGEVHAVHPSPPQKLYFRDVFGAPLAPQIGGPSSVAVEPDLLESSLPEIVADSTSEGADADPEMLFGPSAPATAASETDDEAMQDAAEVEALVENEPLMDVDDDVTDEPLPEPVPLTTVTTHRSSCVSSRSSTSEHWPATPADEDELELVSFDAWKQPASVGTAIFPPRKTYGGFRAITLKDHVTEQKTYLQHCKYSRDLPHIFQDYVNDMPMYLRALPEMRRVFEAMIMENTVQDEPDAPKIEVQNNVDEEPTPPWEFYYSNEMWLGEGVPRPDIDNLVRCSCKGACNPKSKTCACLKRQRDACQDPNLEFAYDKTGKLKIPGYPIFECNDLCGCGDECRNRVVQHGRKVSVSIKKTHLKGWGVFATKKILAGTFIGIYSGELITDVVAHTRGINYNKFGRTYLFDIDFHHLKDDDSNWNNKFTVDAYHAGNFTRFLNHSCDPNSRLFACYINEGNIEKPLLVIFSLRDIEANEEICFNYQGDYPGDEDESKDVERNGEEREEGEEKGLSMAAEARDSIYQKCRCGARNCTGIMFK